MRAESDIGPRRTAEVEAIDDASLVAGALEGDRVAIDRLLRRHVDELTRVVARQLGATDEVDDVVQDSLVLAVTKLADLRNPAAFRWWLLRIGVNEVRRLWKRRRLRRLVGFDRREPPPCLEEFAGSDASPELRAELSLLDRVVRKLPAEQRLAWSLRLVEGYALKDVAAACGCSLATAKRRISAAQRVVGRVVDIEGPSDA